MQEVPDRTACISYRWGFLSNKEKKRLAYLWSAISTYKKQEEKELIIRLEGFFPLYTSVEMHILLADCFSSFDKLF